MLLPSIPTLLLSFSSNLVACSFQVNLLSIHTPKNLVCVTTGRYSLPSWILGWKQSLLLNTITTDFFTFNVSLLTLNQLCRIVHSLD